MSSLFCMNYSLVIIFSLHEKFRGEGNDPMVYLSPIPCQRGEFVRGEVVRGGRVCKGQVDWHPPFYSDVVFSNVNTSEHLSLILIPSSPPSNSLILNQSQFNSVKCIKKVLGGGGLGRGATLWGASLSGGKFVSLPGNKSTRTFTNSYSFWSTHTCANSYFYQLILLPTHTLNVPTRTFTNSYF